MSETILFRNLRRELGDDLFDALEPEWLLSILNEDTLLTFSLYYPFIVKGIRILESYSIPTKDTHGNISSYYKFKIPNETPELPFIGIENYYVQNNFMNDIYSYGSSFAVDSIMGKIRSNIPVPQIRWSIRFEPPDIAVMDPVPKTFIPFSLDMQRIRRLNEFPLYYYEMIKKLFFLDVKMAIYNKFKNIRDTANIGGIEVISFISEYSDAKSERQDLLEKFENDYYKNPERFASFLQHDSI